MRSVPPPPPLARANLLILFCLPFVDQHRPSLGPSVCVPCDTPLNLPHAALLANIDMATIISWLTAPHVDCAPIPVGQGAWPELAGNWRARA